VEALVIVFRLILLLVVIILGCFAAQMLIKVLVPLLPVIGVLVVVILVFGAWLAHMRRF
jgi:hypothetical protein